MTRDFIAEKGWDKDFWSKTYLKHYHQKYIEDLLEKC